MPPPSESEAETQTTISSPSQKFVPQEDDEETLWEVICITGEKNGLYKVRWKGVDPKTRKSWPQSWVRKSDCTDDLVIEWRRKKKKDEEKAKVSKGGSVASKKSGRASTVSTAMKGSPSKQPVASTSKSIRRSKSSSTATALGDATTSKPPRTSAAVRSTATATPTGRRQSRNVVIEEEDELESNLDVEPQRGKRRKERVFILDSRPLLNAKKRKIADANSASSSANLKPHPTNDADEGGNALEKHSTSRPTKKRKVEVEVMKMDPEDEEVESRKSLTQSQSRTSSQHQQPRTTQESYPLQMVRGKVVVPEEEEDEDEEDERMVEDALSEAGASSPREFENAGGEDFYIPPDDGEVDTPNPQNSNKYRPREEDEESEESSPPPKPRQVPRKTNAQASTSTTTKNAKSRIVGYSSSSPSSRSSPPAPAVPLKFGPPLQKRPTAKSSTKSGTTSNIQSKPVPRIQKPRIGSSHHTSREPSCSGSLPSFQYPISQDHVSPPPSGSAHPPAPTNEISVFYNGDAEEHAPILSPAAKRRLAWFDKEVMGLKKGKPNITQEEEKEETESEVEIVEVRLTKRTFIPDPTSPLIRAFSSGSVGTTNYIKALNNNGAESTVTQHKDDDARAAEDTDRSTKPQKSEDHIPKPKTNTTPISALLPQRASEPPTNSYDNDIVPETDQSQSQELKFPAAGPSTPKRTTTTVTRPGSLKSRMKPRTRTASPSLPNSSNTSKIPKDRSLRPIPMLSPSTFHPLLPIPELDSSLPESIIEPAEEGSGMDDDDDAPMSSIEQFDTPEKVQRKAPAKGVFVLKSKVRKRSKSAASNVSGRESASEIWESEVVQRGQAIAEAAKKNNGLEAPTGPKRTVEEIQAAAAAAASRNRQASMSQVDEDEDVEDLSTVPVPPASGPQAGIDDDSLTLQEMEAAYVDLSGGTGDVPAPDPVLLRQEEEESTQDVMLELEQMQHHQREMDSVDLESGSVAAPAAGSSRDSEHGSSESDRSEPIPEIMIANPSRSASARPYSPEPELNPPHDPRARLRSRSRSKTPAVVVSQKTSRRGSKSDLGVLPTKPATRRSATPSLRPPQDGPSSNNDMHRAESEAGPEPKPQEIPALEAQLSPEQTITETRVLDSVTEEREPDHEVQIDEATKQITDINAQWAAEKANWEAERGMLVADIESALHKKVDAEKDRDFFREQYAKASGFVSSVRDENSDLEKRIKIAEGQAHHGVGLVKATFELRVKALEEDAKSWRKMAEFLIEKDQRTNNDELRRRAASEPELRAQCERQQGALAADEDRIEQLELLLEEKASDLSVAESQIQKWQKETTRLYVELNEALTKLDRIGRAGGDDSMDGSADGHEFVYVCKWRPGGTGENEACREVFATISELEQHLVSPGGHLQESYS